MIDFEGLVNCRDLGGLALENSGVTRSGVLFRGETPQIMTENDVRRALDEFRIRRVIDLRGQKRVLGAHPGGSGRLGDEGRSVNIDFIELAGGTGAINLSADGFLIDLLDRGAKPLKIFLEHFVSTNDAVLVHCHTGKDRTGFVVALTLALVGVRDDEIVADYAMSGPIFEAMKANLAKKGIPVVLSAPAFAQEPPSVESMKKMLRNLRAKWSTAESWAMEHGIDRELIDRTRMRLVT